MRRHLSPLTPVFNPDRTVGDVLVGNTPVGVIPVPVALVVADLVTATTIDSVTLTQFHAPPAGTARLWLGALATSLPSAGSTIINGTKMWLILQLSPNSTAGGAIDIGDDLDGFIWDSPDGFTGGRRTGGSNTRPRFTDGVPLLQDISGLVGPRAIMIEITFVDTGSTTQFVWDSYTNISDWVVGEVSFGAFSGSFHIPAVTTYGVSSTPDASALMPNRWEP